MIGVVGLGTMGLGIAQVYAASGQDVLLTDRDDAARGAAAGRIGDSLTKRVDRGRMSAEEREAILGRLRVVDGTEAMARCAMVVEAIVERIEAKQDLFSALEAVIAGDAVLATNTSSLSVGKIAEGLDRPERLVGLHFFNPAPAMKLVEIVAHDGTDAAVSTRARDLTEAAGKTVVQAPDSPGFIVNRCARPFYGEALAMLEEGRSAAEIDAALVADGYRIGPFALIDLIGADINLAASEGVATAMNGHPRYHVFDTLRRQVASGDLGRKTGAGFVTEQAEAPGDAGAVQLRMAAVLANEAASLLGDVDEGGIDTAMRLGLNFPRGPLEGARAIGLDRIRDELRRLDGVAPPHLAGRYAIVPELEAMR